MYGVKRFCDARVKLSQPSAFANRAMAANSGNSLEINRPSYSLRKPSPMAAPKLAMAGKQAAQPIAETTLPSAPVLSAMRVISPMKRLSLLSLACWLTA